MLIRPPYPDPRKWNSMRNNNNNSRWMNSNVSMNFPLPPHFMNSQKFDSLYTNQQYYSNCLSSFYHEQYRSKSEEQKLKRVNYPLSHSEMNPFYSNEQYYHHQQHQNQYQHQQNTNTDLSIQNDYMLSHANDKNSSYNNNNAIQGENSIKTNDDSSQHTINEFKINEQEQDEEKSEEIEVLQVNDFWIKRLALTVKRMKRKANKKFNDSKT